MKSYDYISIAISAYLIIVGLATLFTGKVYTMGSSAAKYTEESLKKFTKPLGLSNLVGGIGLLAYDLLQDKHFEIGLIVMAVLIIISLVIYFMGKKVLVKK